MAEGFDVTLFDDREDTIDVTIPRNSSNITVEFGDDEIDAEFTTVVFERHADTHESGGSDELELSNIPLSADFDLSGNDLVDGAQVIWDTSTQSIPSSLIGTIPNASLENDSITVNAGDALDGGGTVSLGGSFTLGVIAGNGISLANDAVNVATNGIALDELDESISPTWTGAHTFNGTLELNQSQNATTNTIRENGSGDIVFESGSVDYVMRNTGQFRVNDGGIYSNGDLLIDNGNISFDSLSPELRTRGNGGDSISIFDTANSSELMIFNEGGTIDVNQNRITNLPQPTGINDAVNKQYADSLAQGLQLKDAAQVSPTANIDLTSSTDPNPVDGYTVQDGDRVLLKEQTNAVENGIYVANTAADPSTWTRSTDADDTGELIEGTFVFVENGTQNGNTSWIITSPDPIDIGTDAITISQFASAGEILAGTGLNKVGQTISVDQTFDFDWTGVHTFSGNVILDDYPSISFQDEGEIRVNMIADGFNDEMEIGIFNDSGSFIDYVFKLDLFSGGNLRMEGGHGIETVSGDISSGGNIISDGDIESTNDTLVGGLLEFQNAPGEIQVTNTTAMSISSVGNVTFGANITLEDSGNLFFGSNNDYDFSYDPITGNLDLNQNGGTILFHNGTSFGFSDPVSIFDTLADGYGLQTAGSIQVDDSIELGQDSSSASVDFTDNGVDRFSIYWDDAGNELVIEDIENAVGEMIRFNGDLDRIYADKFFQFNTLAEFHNSVLLTSSSSIVFDSSAIIDYDSQSDEITFDTQIRAQQGINLSNSSSIQDAGVDALTFDGSQNITAPNGSVTVAGGQSAISFSDSATIETSGAGDDIIQIVDAANNEVMMEFAENAAISVPSRDIDMSSNIITNLPTPTNATDAVRKQYVDGVAQGVIVKDSVVASPTANVDLNATTDPNPVDGVTLQNGDRVLLKAQTNAVENGIYIANTATDPSTWTRSTDFDDDAEVVEGVFVFVESGTQNGNSSFIVTSQDPINVGTDAITFTQFATAGEITAGDGLIKSGQQLSVNESFNFSFTGDISFGAGFDTQGAITDGAQTIWDDIAGEIPDSAMGSIDNATLTNDSLTVNGGDGLQNGGLVALGGSTTLDVDPGFAITTSSGQIDLDPSESIVWSNVHRFNTDIILDTGIRIPEDTNNARLANMNLTTGVAQDATISYELEIDDNTVAEIAAESNGSGNTKNRRLVIGDGNADTTALVANGAGVEIQEFDTIRNVDEILGTGDLIVDHTAVRYQNATPIEELERIDAIGLTINTDGSGSDTVSIVDSNASANIAVFNEGGRVDFPSGNVRALSGKFVAESTGGFELGLNSGFGLFNQGTGGLELISDDTAALSITRSAADYLDFGRNRGAGVTGFSLASNDDGAIWNEDNNNAYFYFRTGATPSIEMPDADLESGGTSGALELGERASVADGGRVQLSRDSNVLGYAMIQDVTNDEAVMVFLGGGSNSVEIVHDSGGGNNFTTSKGNDGTTNIYYDSTNARYEINNETGATVTYGVEVLKG